MIFRIIYLTLVLFIGFSCNKVNESQIEIDKNIFLGKISNENPVEFVIKCKNNYNKDVILKKVGVSCNCLQATGQNNRVIHGHDSIVFRFSFVPEGIGYVEKIIDLI